MIVVDTNIIAYLFLRGEHTKEVIELVKNDFSWISPVLWKSEFRSVLSLYIRKKFIGLAEAKTLMGEAEHLMQGSEFVVHSDQVLDLVSRSGCSSYDCEFVALAMDLNLPLITSDRKIIDEFPQFAFSIQNFLRR